MIIITGTTHFLGPARVGPFWTLQLLVLLSFSVEGRGGRPPKGIYPVKIIFVGTSDFPPTATFQKRIFKNHDQD